MLGLSCIVAQFLGNSSVRMLNGAILRIVTLAIILTNSYPALSLPSDSSKQLTLEAISAEFDEAKGITTYSGQVIMKQGSMLIRADKLVIYGRFDAANKVIATGKPAYFQQTPNLQAQPVRASADTLEYRIDNETLMLLGNAELDQEGSSLNSNSIEYDVKKAIVKAGSTQEKENESGRVRMVIPPKTFQPKKDSTPPTKP